MTSIQPVGPQEVPSMGTSGHTDHPETHPQRPAMGFAKSKAYIADARKRTARAEAFDMDDILARYQSEQGFSDAVVVDHHRELIRFMSLCATGINEGKFYGMMGAIDELWHTFVIFTREYAQFCDKVAGQFMHHVPEVQKSGVSDDTLEHYFAFLDDYEKVYGEPAPAAYWPRPGLSALGVSDTACTGCKGCNSCTGHSCTVH